MRRRRVTDPAPPDPLLQLSDALAGAVPSLQRLGTHPDRDRLIGLVLRALVELHAVAAQVPWLRGAAPIPAAGAAWLHELREPVAAIAVWAGVLGGGDPAKHDRAVEAIDRNAMQLLELLEEPPG